MIAMIRMLFYSSIMFYPPYVVHCIAGQASGLHYEAEDLRQQCVLFLHYVKIFISR